MLKKLSTLLVLSLLFGARSLAELPFAEEPAVRGNGYVPPIPFTVSVDENTPDDSGLANWMLIENGCKAKKVRFVGFSKDKKNTGWGWSTADERTMRLLNQGLDPYFIRRYGLSDFSEQRGGVFEGTLGVIVVSLEDSEFVIGVSQSRFYFGRYRGSTHQAFESWTLARLLDETLQRETGKGLDPKTFAALSGEAVIQTQKDRYSDIGK